jgi:cell division protein FtsN
MKKINTLLLAVCCLAVVFSSCETSKKATKNKTKPKQEVVTPKQENVQPTPVEVKQEETPVFDEAALLKARSERFKLSDTDSNTGKLLKKYNVIVGSFASKANAEKLQYALKSEGYDALVVINESGMYRVVAVSFDDYASAKTKIKSIASRFSDAWVLVQKD